MKAILVILIATLMVVSGCSFNNSSEQTRQIVEVDSYASCLKVELRDIEENPILVPDEITESFDCVTGAASLSPNSEYLIYDYEEDLKLYDFDSENIEILTSFKDSLEGISCIWNDVGTEVACVAVNQEEYDGATKIFIFEIEEGELVEKQGFAQTHETMVDFICGASCYPGDFWFEGGNILKYRGHNMIAPDEVFEIEY
ncbi:hypothetical protein ACFL3C_01360 [Patescibacteria group bacterium]